MKDRLFLANVSQQNMNAGVQVLKWNMCKLSNSNPQKCNSINYIQMLTCTANPLSSGWVCWDTVSAAGGSHICVSAGPGQDVKRSPRNAPSSSAADQSLNSAYGHGLCPAPPRSTHHTAPFSSSLERNIFNKTLIRQRIFILYKSTVKVKLLDLQGPWLPGTCLCLLFYFKTAWIMMRWLLPFLYCVQQAKSKCVS